MRKTCFLAYKRQRLGLNKNIMNFYLPDAAVGSGSETQFRVSKNEIVKSWRFKGY